MNNSKEHCKSNTEPVPVLVGTSKELRGSLGKKKREGTLNPHFRAVAKLFDAFVVYCRGLFTAARSFVQPQGAGRDCSTGLRHAAQS